MPRILPQQVEINAGRGAPGIDVPNLGPGAGTEVFGGLSDVADKLQNIFRIQQDNSDKLKVGTAVATASQALLQHKLDAANLPTDQMLPTYKEASDKSIQGILQDPQYASPRLQQLIAPELGRLQTQGIEDVMVHRASAAQAEQDAQLKNLEQQAVPLAAGSYSTTAAGFVDKPEAVQAREQFANTVKGLTSFRPDEKAQMLQNFDRQVSMQRAQSIAQNQPVRLDDYLKTLPFALTPEQHQALVTQATEAINQPMKQIDANNNAMRAGLIQKFDQQVQQNGHVNSSQLSNAIAHKFITPEDYQRYTGVPYVEPSDPATVAAMTSMIKNATPDNIDEIELAARTNPNIRGRGLVEVTGAAAIQKAAFKTAEGKAKADSRDTINKAFDDLRTTSAPGAVIIHDRLAPVTKQLTTAQAKAAAISAYEAAIAETKDPAAIRAAAAKAIKDNLPDLSKKHPNPLAAGLPARKSGESDADWGKRIRMAGPVATPSLGDE